VCGIAGIVHARLGAAELAARLERMRAAMRHRGPDDAGSELFAEQQGGLAACRLSILDLQRGHQPMLNEDGDVCAVLNGEIYNHQQLRAELERRGHRFRSRCDTEVLVHLYEQEGARFVERLEGMFGLAVYDRRRRRLLLARDRAGMKPLYLAETPQGLAFASEIRALFASGLVRPAPDFDAVNTALAVGFVPAPRSGFAGVEKLASGTLVEVGPDERVERRRFWTLRFQAPPAAQTEAGFAAELGQRLEAAVRSHLVADVPVGAFLSGGWDSSLVATYAARHCHGALRTYSIVFPDNPDADESRYARAVARALGSDHREIEFRSRDLPELTPRVVRHSEEPLWTSPAALIYQVAGLAARDVKVALSGEGSDELFAGYPRFATTRYYPLRRFLPRPLLRAAAPHLPRARWRYILRIAGAAEDWLADLEAFRPAGLEGFAAALRPPLRISSADLRPARPARETLASCRDHLQRRLAIDFLGRLADGILVASDKVSMAHSLECRMPFLDPGVLDFALGLPSEMKRQGGRAKVVLSHLARQLPPEVAGRRKKGLAFPGDRSFADVLARWMREAVLDRARPDGPLDRGKLEALLGPGRDLGGHPLVVPWRLLMLQCWWSEFFDSPAGAFFDSTAAAPPA
jgi:asparagine synthase (glutamine-hydrolysing)